MNPVLPLLKPIPIKDRISVLFVERGNLDVLNGTFKKKSLVQRLFSPRRVKILQGAKEVVSGNKTGSI
jgi:hypothetical protein